MVNKMISSRSRRTEVHLKYRPGYIIVDVMETHDLEGESKFWLTLFNFSVNKASLAAGQALWAP